MVIRYIHATAAHSRQIRALSKLHAVKQNHTLISIQKQSRHETNYLLIMGVKHELFLGTCLGEGSLTGSADVRIARVAAVSTFSSDKGRWRILRLFSSSSAPTANGGELDAGSAPWSAANRRVFRGLRTSVDTNILPDRKMCFDPAWCLVGAVYSNRCVAANLLGFRFGLLPLAPLCLSFGATRVAPWHAPPLIGCLAPVSVSLWRRGSRRA
jgi:hypothetical protein